VLRVSNLLMANNTLKYIQNNLQRAARSQEQLSTGKTIIRPSDDPSEISHLMAVNATIKGNEQYMRNIEDGLSYLNQCDSALDTIGQYLQDAKTLTIQGANGTLTQEDREAIAEQIDKQIDALVDLGNSSLGGKYLFAGTKNSQPPFYRDPATGEVYYRGNTDRVTREVIFGYSYEVDAAGVTETGSPGVFGTLDGTSQIDDPMNSGEQMTRVSGGPFEVLLELKQNLENNDADGINQSLQELDDALQEVLNHRVGVGARTRHLEAVKSQLEDQEIKLKTVLVNVQGADIARLTVEAAQNDLVYQASLIFASKFLQTSLLNYLE